MGLLPHPGRLVSSAHLRLEEAESIPAPGDKLEDLLHVGRDPDPVDDEVLHIRMGIQPPGGDPEDDVGELPSAVPSFDYLNKDASVAGGGG